MVISGSVFIADLRRRAQADRRMILFETTMIAGIATAILNARIGPWGIEWGTTAQVVGSSIAVAIAWAVVAAVFSSLATKAYREYAVSILVDTGLLYLALEHEPAEMLGPMKAAEKVLRISAANAPSVLSFRQRMTALVRKFPACASAIGFYPQPAMWRMARVVLLATAFGLVGIFSWVVWSAYQAAKLELVTADWPLKLAGIALVWTVMLFTILASAQRSAPAFALSEVLLGEDQTGSAVRAGRGI